MEFNYNFKVEANSKEEADKIATAMNTLYKHINNDDLVWVSAKIREDPKVISKVVKLANNPMVKRLW